MKIFKSTDKLKKEILNIKDISFVPTMGGFHKGHISLINKSKKMKGKSLVSIFVNPKQFNSKKDFKDYPRNMKEDIKILEKLKVDYVFLPSFKEIFNFRTKNKIFLDKFAYKLCGKTRKGHFEGVLNVVNRFLEIIRPKNILLGRKDYQQLYLIKKHVSKRKINTKIISCKTIRENNGIACSTRNKNIKKKDLQKASKVYFYLKNKKKLIKKKLINFQPTVFKSELKNIGIDNVDYLKLIDLKTLKKPINKKSKSQIFFAYYLSNIRLIDNI